MSYSSNGADYTLVYDFSTLGEFGDPNPRYNLKDLPVVACSLAYANKDKVEQVVNQTWKRNFAAFYHCKMTDTHAFIFTDAPRDAKLIVLAFRGSASISNWFSDLNYKQIPVHTPYSGKMYAHRGFWTALSDEQDVTTVYKAGKQKEVKAGPAFGTIRDTLIGLAGEHPNAKILVTGHSLGGALALVFSLKLSIEKHDNIMKFDKYKVMTFGQPRVGDSALRVYIKKLGLNYTRVVNRFDVVANVPFTVWGVVSYSHVGTLLLCHDDGTDDLEPDLLAVDPEGNIPNTTIPYHGIELYVSRTKERMKAGKAPELLWMNPSYEEQDISQPLTLADITMWTGATSGLKIKEQIPGREALTLMNERFRARMIQEVIVDKVREELVQKMREVMREEVCLTTRSTLPSNSAAVTTHPQEVEVQQNISKKKVGIRPSRPL